ncbi:unnamed protein product [Trichobilharzia szidati]|nr:unnamed protein product [Trichobilharzia szidati]
MLRRIEVPRSSSGFGFRLRNEYPCYIDHILSGSSAEKSGVRIGDRLLKVNGEDVTNMTHENVASLIWKSHRSLIIEVLSSDLENNTYIPSTPGPSSPDRCLISGIRQKASSFGRNSAVFIYAGCVKVPMDFRLCAKDLSILRKKANSVVNKINASARSLCLVRVSRSVLRVRLYEGYVAEYPASCLYVAGLVDFDEKFVYIVTRSILKHNSDPIMETPESQSETNDNKSMNCHVFRTLPSKFLAHSGHSTIAETFGIHCSNDILTGECCNFPSSTTGILSYLYNLLGKSGLQNIINSGDRRNSCVQTEQSIDLNCVPASTTATHFGPKRCRKSLPDPINVSIFSKFLKPKTPSRNSRVMNPKNSEIVKTDTDEQPSKIGCFSSTVEDIENVDPSRVVDSSPCSSSNPAFWAEDFDNLLNDPIGRNEFRKFLTTEYSSENLEFLMSVRNWRDSFEIGNVQESARDIFNQFLAPDAPQAVNIDHSALKSASSCLSNPHINMFLEAENQVYTLMKTDSYPRYLESSSYLNYLNEFNVNKSSKKLSSFQKTHLFRSKSKPFSQKPLTQSAYSNQINDSESTRLTRSLTINQTDMVNSNRRVLRSDKGDEKHVTFESKDKSINEHSAKGIKSNPGD